MEVLKIIKSLYVSLQPLNRSLLGEGNRKTLEIINKLIPLDYQNYSSGKKVFDWTIPKQWNVSSAWIKDDNGNVLIDITESILNVVQYSCSVKASLTYDEIKSKIYYDKDLPNAVPYKTSYYNKDWGFCCSYNDFKKKFKKNSSYEVYINSSFKEDQLLIGEYNIKGNSKKTILFSTYICHPLMVNDNLSGIVLGAILAKYLTDKKTNYSYKFLFLPETIGAISWLSENNTENIIGGFSLSCAGGPGKFSYKKTFKGDHFLDYIIAEAFDELAIPKCFESFTPQGSDERQFSSPGVRIPMAGVYKDKFHEYPYYHTSLDNFNVCKPEHLASTFDVFSIIIKKIELLIFPAKKILKCETKLDKYNLYPKVGRTTKALDKTKLSQLDIILWVLFYADGSYSDLEISKKTGINHAVLLKVISLLRDKKILY